MSGGREDPRRGRWSVTLALGAVALVLRLAFLAAGPGAAWPHSVLYKGDAIVWVRYAAALRSGVPFELGLPLRPPGNAYLIAVLQELGLESPLALEVAWCVLGALGVALLHRALLRDAGPRVAGLAAGGAAAASAWLMLATSLNNEVPYLVLALGALALAGGGDARRGRWLGAAALHGLATLFRVEHALFYGLLLARELLRRRPRAALASLLVFAAVLVPWHVRAWSAVAAHGAGRAPRDPAAERRLAEVEARAAPLLWDDEARAALEDLPADVRRPMGAFVAATAQHRGRSRVRAEDLAVLEEAFGTVPRPLPRFFLVALYGGLNLSLANGPWARGGFQRGPLELPPPLAGGPERYPPDLVSGLPPAALALEYPPHRAELTDGGRRAAAWIAGHPLAWLSLVARKLAIAWSGAAPTLGGFGLPLGLSGERRAVDLTVAVGPWATGWRLLVLAACAAGLRAARGRGLGPWLLLGVSQAAVTALFFGYARLGAIAAPTVLLLLALSLERWALPPLERARPALARRFGPAALGLLVALELARAAFGTSATLDGLPVGDRDPVPLDAHGDRTVELSLGRRTSS